jgi:hypothetical protein
MAIGLFLWSFAAAFLAFLIHIGLSGTGVAPTFN